MAKLTKKQTDQLNNIMYHLTRANNIIKDDKLKGFAYPITEKDSNGGDYTLNNKEGASVINMPEHVRVISKNGSHINGLNKGLSLLSDFIENNTL